MKYLLLLILGCALQIGCATIDPSWSDPKDKKLSKKEQAQLAKLRQYLTSTKDQDDFLGSNDQIKTQLIQKNILTAKKEEAEEHEYFFEIAEAGDIALGMPLELVKKSWGEPDQEWWVPGTESFQMVYSKQVPTAYGYQAQNNIVFIENGKVQGWEKK